jgi:hypothetical protein
VNLETSTLSGWVGATVAALNPLIDALAADVMASDTLHVDDIPVPVLAPGTRKNKTGRLWTYVRDERSFAGARSPAALFFYSPDRKGAHPGEHLKEFRGVIHADGYAGFNELSRIVEAGCWPMSDESSSMCTPPLAPQSPRRRSTASASSTGSRRRSRASRPITATRTPGAIEADHRCSGRLGGRDRAQAVAQIRTRGRLPLHAGALDRAAPLLRRRPARARQ